MYRERSKEVNLIQIYNMDPMLHVYHALKRVVDRVFTFLQNHILAFNSRDCCVAMIQKSFQICISPKIVATVFTN